MDKNEAIKIIRSNFPTGRIMLCEALETLIPELKENDESIRKWIKKELENKYVEDGVVNNVFADKAFAWLEKQKYTYETTKDKFYLEGFEEGRLYEKRGKTKSISEIVSTEQKHEINDDVLLRFAFYQYDDDTLYLSSVFVEECNRKRGYGRKILKAAEEVAKTFGISKIRLKVESNTWMEEWYKRNGYEHLTHDGKYNWLEKQCEKKQHLELKDGYDTKFKVGDWVVLEDSLSTYKIVEVCKSWYEVISNNDGMQYYIGFDEEDDCRLWSIDDANDGDVLSTKKGNPFIYDKNRYNNGLAYYYAGIDANEELTLKNPHNMLSHFGELRSVFPATKEQRDLLFKKMKEAGYKWDNNKKELVRYKQ